MNDCTIMIVEDSPGDTDLIKEYVADDPQHDYDSCGQSYLGYLPSKTQLCFFVNPGQQLANYDSRPQKGRIQDISLGTPISLGVKYCMSSHWRPFYLRAFFESGEIRPSNPLHLC